MSECENYLAREIITYFVQPVNVWASACSMSIVCRLCMFPVCRRVLQQPPLSQTIWQQSNWHHQLKNTVNDVIMNITFTCLPLMEHSSFDGMLNSHYQSMELRTGKDTTIQNYAYLWQESVKCLSGSEHEHIPRSVQQRRDQERWEQLTLVVCNWWRHMPALAECLQT